MRRKRLLVILALVLSSASMLARGGPAAYAVETAHCLKRWHSVPFPLRGSVTFSSVAVHGSRAWALGYADSGVVIERWRAPRWHRMPPPPVTARDYVDAIAANAPNDLWIVGTRASATDPFSAPTSFHWDGRSWTRMRVPSAAVVPGLGGGGGILTAVTAVGRDDVWATGIGHELDDGNPDALAVHWNGSAWRRYPWGAGATQDVAADSLGDVWFAGLETKEIDWLTASARLHEEPFGGVETEWRDDWTESLLTAVAAGASDVWTVGEFSTFDASGPIIERWQSGQFVLAPVEGSVDLGLSDVAAAGTHAFAVGADSQVGPVIERWRNGVWGPVHLPSAWTNRSLTSIALGPDGSAWAVGSFIARSCIGPV